MATKLHDTSVDVGTKGSVPTGSSDGGAGTIYWNTSDNKLYCKDNGGNWMVVAQ